MLGAPVRLTVNNLVNTDFVLEEPPKHAYWDEAAQQIDVISRIPTIAASLTNTEGTSFSGKDMDSSAESTGGSAAFTAGVSATAGLIAKVNISAEFSSKTSYNYEKNKANYNSNYASRTLNETQSTDNDDFISGRAQITRHLALPGFGAQRPGPGWQHR